MTNSRRITTSWTRSWCFFATVAVAAVTLAAHYENPVFRGSMPDPGVMLHDGTYYAFGTTGSERLPDGRVFRVLESSDLVGWSERGGALQPLESDEEQEYWAPEAVFFEGVFYLYYSVGTLDDLRFEVRVATSDAPAGPYTDTGVPLTAGDGTEFAIDGHPFRDADGRWYLFYAKDFVDNDNGNHTGTGIVVDRLIDMVRVAGKPQTVVRPRYAWTLFQENRKMPMYGDGEFDWHTIEAPWVVRRNGKYFCFYSGANFGTPRYGLDYVVADSVLGPYGDQGRYPRVLRGVADLVRGPGHHSVVRSPSGDRDVVVYHAWDRAMTRREMCIDPLVWTSAGPRCLGPTVARQQLYAPRY